jgi:hypothetical protein
MKEDEKCSSDSKERDYPPQNLENSESRTTCQANSAVKSENLGTLAANTKKEVIVSGVVYTRRE